MGLSLLEMHLQNEEKRSSNEWEDDGEGTESPSPADFVVKFIGHLGTCESRDNIRGRSECVSKTSILELGDIGCDDINAVDQTSESAGVEDLIC